MDETNRKLLLWFRANGPDGAVTESNTSTLQTAANRAAEALGSALR